VPKTPKSSAGLERNQVPLSAEITCRFRPKSGAGLLRFLQFAVNYLAGFLLTLLLLPLIKNSAPARIVKHGRGRRASDPQSRYIPRG
jgi:hypothetical protein